MAKQRLGHFCPGGNRTPGVGALSTDPHQRGLEMVALNAGDSGLSLGGGERDIDPRRRNPDSRRMAPREPPGDRRNHPAAHGPLPPRAGPWVCLLPDRRPSERPLPKCARGGRCCP